NSDHAKSIMGETDHAARFLSSGSFAILSASSPSFMPSLKAFRPLAISPMTRGSLPAPKITKTIANNKTMWLKLIPMKFSFAELLDIILGLYSSYLKNKCKNFNHKSRVDRIGIPLIQFKKRDHLIIM